MVNFNQPLSGNDMPRFAGHATIFRLPAPDMLGEPQALFRLPPKPTESEPQALSESSDEPLPIDVGIVGVPLDIGTSNRTGARYGPRQIRSESVLVRPYGMATGAAPFDSFQVADLGDVPLNAYSLEKSVAIIEDHYHQLMKHGCKTISLGGDHTVTLPILRAQAALHGPLAVIHVDAHADMNDEMFGERVTHGTIFRRAIEEQLIDPSKMIQIGLRATGYAADDFDWARNQGCRWCRQKTAGIGLWHH